MMKSSKQISMTAILVALSVALSFVKIQGSIAFDAMPAFVGAIIAGPLLGGIIAFVGHIATAATSGFYLSLPTHIVIAVSMFIAAFVLGTFTKKNNNIMLHCVGIVLAIMINLLPLIYLGITVNFAVAASFFVSLLVAATINVLLGYIIGIRLKKVDL